MDVILLERVAKLGGLGEVVTVKPGYARNFLLPQGKALRANKANLAYFETQRASLEAKNAEKKSEAEGVATKLDGTTYVAVRSAGETGQLYGSVAARDIAQLLADAGFDVARNTVQLNQPIKIIGLHDVVIALHPEVEATITVNVARSEDEAERQAAGEDLTRRDYDDDDAEEEGEGDELSIEDVFENPEDVDLGDGAEEGDADQTDAEEKVENMTMGDEAQPEEEPKA